MGFETPITIAKVIDGIQTADYVLPENQQEYVWNGEQIVKLFPSPLRGFLLAQSRFGTFTPKS